MKKMNSWLILDVMLTAAFLIWGALFFFLGPHPETVHAQAAPPWQVAVPSVPHTACTVAPLTTQYCFAGDGLWVSLNGAAYTQVGSGGVQSINGKTGIVVITAVASPGGPPTITIQ